MIAAAQAGGEVDNAVLDQLTAWDGNMRADAPEPLIFTAWVREAVRAIYPRRSGRRLRALLRRARAGADPAAGGPRQGPRLVRRPRDAGPRELRRRAGRGARHRAGRPRAALRHGPIEVAVGHGAHGAWRAPSVRALRRRRRASSTSRCRAPAATTRSTAARWISARSRRSPTGTRSSYRAIYDLADLDRSLYIHTTGQSGNPFSPVYRSFAERWSKGEYIEIPTKRADIDKVAIGTWRLAPQ